MRVGGVPATHFILESQVIDGSDPDAGDVLTYTLYVDKVDGKQSPFSSGLSLSSIELTLDSGSTYYCRVKTTDQTNISSFSSISTFSL